MTLTLPTHRRLYYSILQVKNLEYNILSLFSLRIGWVGMFTLKITKPSMTDSISNKLAQSITTSEYFYLKSHYFEFIIMS